MFAIMKLMRNSDNAAVVRLKFMSRPVEETAWCG